ncbi:MAG: GNAT family N-acetyltransferase [Pseudomonadota bacterium]
MQYRPMTIEDVPGFARLMRLGFGDPAAMTEYYTELLGTEWCRGLFDGDRMVASIGFIDDAHRLGGGSVSTWGVTAVGVDPAARGRGVSGALIKQSLEEAAKSGVSMMTLYASAPAVYRKMGYERAGKMMGYKAKTAQLALSGKATGRFDVVDATADDTAKQLAEIRESWLKLANGPFERNEAFWQFLLKPYDKTADVYVWRDDQGTPAGYAIIHETREKLEVADLCVPTGDAASAMLAFFGGFRAIFTDVNWTGSPVDPLIMAMNDRWWETTRHEHWFSRITDAEKALKQRGYPAGLEARLSLAIDDPILPNNAATFGIEVADSTATVARAPGTDASLNLSVQSLAPLFTGFVSASRLAAMGRLTGPREMIETADRVFSGPMPWLEESF